jgi:hypothetical protein
MVSASLCGRAVLYSAGVMVRTRVCKSCWKVLVPQPCLTSDLLCGNIRCSLVCRTGLWGFRSAVSRMSAWLISLTVCSDAHCAQLWIVTSAYISNHFTCCLQQVVTWQLQRNLTGRLRNQIGNLTNIYPSTHFVANKTDRQTLIFYLSDIAVLWMCTKQTGSYHHWT